MINVDEWTITDAVLEAQAGCTDPRMQQVLTSLVRHLHDFAREVKLTEAEWMTGIEFLTAIGRITTERRQEFILLSDTLGLSTLVTAQNNVKPPACTESTVFGPFFVVGAPNVENGGDVANGAHGEPCFVSATVSGLGGERIGGADIAVWQSDEEGFYDVQIEGLDHPQARGNLRSLEDGSLRFKSILAAPYPIPHDGPVGRMLEHLGRHPWRPAHLHFMITVPGYQTLVTHVFRSGGRYLESDAVFGVRSSLIADWVRHEAGPAPDGSRSETPFHTLHYDFVLNPAAQQRP